MHTNQNPTHPRRGTFSWRRALSLVRSPRSLGTVVAAVMALAIAATAFGVARDAEAQGSDPPPEHSGGVTIVAQHPTALEGIDDLVFTVTRALAADYDLVVPVALSSGIIDSARLSHTVTIPADNNSAVLRVHTGSLDPVAVTGDVTATVGGGDLHDVGDPASASVSVHVGETLVTVRFSAGSYTLAESIGTTTDEIILVAETVPGVPAPAGSVGVLVSTEGVTAGVGDYHLAHAMFLFGSTPGFPWTAVGDVYRSEIPVPLAVGDDGLVEGAETLQLTVNRAPGVAGTVGVVPADSTAPPCDASGCNADVTIVDNDIRGVTVSETGTLPVDEGATAAYTVVLDSEPTGDVTVTPEVQGATDADISVSEALTFTAQNWHVPQTVIVTAGSDDNRISGSATITHTVMGGDYEANGVTAAPVPVAEADFEGRTIVSLVYIPDGTTVRDGSTVADGTTFAESDKARFRILMSAADGGPLVGGADVELSFDWDPSPLSGQISRIVLSLPRVGVWDSAVQIRDDDIGNADGTVTARITGCERNGCLIGAPSEITLTIADDDGGPAAAPPGRPDALRLLCPSPSTGFEQTGLEARWQAPADEGGSPVDHYELRYRQRQYIDGAFVNGEWQTSLHDSTSTSTTIVDLDADTSYGVQVQAVNAAGPGPWSLEAAGRTGQPIYICEILDKIYG